MDNIFIFYCWNRRNTVQILFAKQLLPDFHNISGTHCDQQISRSAVVQKISLDLVKGREVFAWSTQLFNLRLKILGRNSKSIGFSCRINVSQNYMVSQGKCLGKLWKKCLGTSISVRLKNAPQLLVGIIVCCV